MATGKVAITVVIAVSDKILFFWRKNIEKLSLCVKGKIVTICCGFELFLAGNVVLDTGSREAYLF
jgi:hypothetical protein